MVFDVRCLPNPYYDPALRPLTGKDEPVIDFLEAETQAREMLADIRHFVERMAALLRWRQPQLSDRCHRLHWRAAPSVYFAESLARYFRNHAQVLVRHRELV